MKSDIVHKVIVYAREGCDLVRLSSSDSPMEVPCGGIGRIIAQQVLDGHGRALIPVSDIRLAVETIDGVNAILDNFDLIDQHTRGPLLHVLLGVYPKAMLE